MWFPAIDLNQGQSVRLYQGDFQQKTVVATDPLQQAQKIAAAGLRGLHLVDLDGAKNGSPQNQAVIQQIVTATNLQVEVGGGIRTLQQIQEYLALGVSRVIIGSAAVKDPQLVAQAVKQFGANRIVVGVDGKNGLVATNGWLAVEKISMADLIEQMQGIGISNFIVTDIARDGTMKGPNVELLGQLQKRFSAVTIIASGGIRNVADLNDLQQHQINTAVIGKALANGSITLEQLRMVS